MESVMLGIIVATIGLLLNAIAMVSGAIWIVGRIRESNAVLANTVEHLNATVSELKGVINVVSRQQNNHETRLSVLESLRSQGK